MPEDFLTPQEVLRRQYSAPPASPTSPTPAPPAVSRSASAAPDPKEVLRRQYAPPTASVAEEGNILFRPVQTIVGGSTLSSIYENSELRKTLETAIPKEIRQSAGGDYTARLITETYKAGPQFLDFMTSPVGLGLIAAHSIPQTRGLAAAADFGLAAWQGKETLDAMKEFVKDRSPENLSHLIVSMAGTMGAAKAGKMSAEKASVRRAAKSPDGVDLITKDTAPIREGIVAAGDEHVAALPEGAAGRQVTEAKQAKIRDQIEALDEAAGTVATAYQPGMIDIPRSWAVKQLDKLYKIPVVREFAGMTNIPKNDLLSIGSDIVGDRAQFIGTQKFDVNRMTSAIARSVPAEDLRIFETNADGTLRPSNKIAAVIQGTVTADEAGLGPESRQAVEVIRKRTLERDALLQEFYGADYKLLDPETYLTQIWDFGKGDGPSGRVAKTIMRDRFVRNQRVIEDYAQGLDISNKRFLEDPTAPQMKPKFNNIIDILHAREQHAITAIANGRMAKVLRDMGAMLNETEVKELGLDWKPLKEAPALYHATYSGTEVYKTEAAARQKASRYRGEPMTTVTQTITYKPVYTHPGIEQAVASIFEKPFENPAAAALTGITSFTKKNVLNFSLFHNGALSEVSQAVQLGGKGMGSVDRAAWLKDPTYPAPGGSLPGKAKQMAAGTYFLNPEYWRGVKATLWDITTREAKDGDAPPVLRLNAERVRPWIERGLDLNSEDRAQGFVDKLRNLEKGNPNPVKRLGNAVGRLWGTGMYLLDKPLWDYYFPGQMLNAAETMMVSEMGKIGKNATPKQIEYVGKHVAETVNNIYGAISWDKLLVSPKTRQVMGWMMLAPAWRVSQLRVLTQGFESASASRIANRYIRNGALAWFASAQAFNYFSTAIYGNPDRNGEQQPHFTWDNPGLPISVAGKDTGISSHVGDIAMGRNPDGRERYLRLNKAMRDSLGYMVTPLEELESGIHPVWKNGWTLLTGHDPVTAYEVVDPNYSAMEQKAQELSAALELIFPLSANDWVKFGEHELFPQVFPMPSTKGTIPGFPSVTGMSYKETQERFIHAMMNDDRALAAVIMKQATINNMNLNSIVSAYKKHLSERRRNEFGSGQKYDVYGNPATAEPPK